MAMTRHISPKIQRMSRVQIGSMPQSMTKGLSNMIQTTKLRNKCCELNSTLERETAKRSQFDFMLDQIFDGEMRQLRGGVLAIVAISQREVSFTTFQHLRAPMILVASY